jgi:hypothetical protein
LAFALAGCGGDAWQPPEKAGAGVDTASSAGVGGTAPMSTSCEGEGCVCADAGSDQSLCGTQCVTLSSDENNCGACGRACLSEQRCQQGRCLCPGTQNECDGVCVDRASDSKNCGSCGHVCEDAELCQGGQCLPNDTDCSPACSGGQQCVNGSCVCGDGQSYCADRCIDTKRDTNNCGACGMRCGDQQNCRTGQCACSSGRVACGTSCVDLQTDTQNCGSCGHACSIGAACSGGSCQGVWGDGCRDDRALSVSLRELAVYQSIKVPVYEANGAVDVTTRVADVIQGRDVLFRAFVDTGAGFKARVLSARLTLKNDATIDRFTSKLRVSQKSTDDDLTTTFQLSVPAAKMGASTSYSLELVECQDGSSGDALATRFPASGEEALKARKTGVLKVTIVPVKVNSRVPDTSSNALDIYRRYLEATYPIEGVELSVGKQISTSSPIDWNTLVEQIRNQRMADAPTDDVYYYGMVQPTVTLTEYCKGGCTAGIGYVTPLTQASTRAAVGLAYSDEISASTMAHELGHNHGRKHSPCPSGISGSDETLANAKVGSWGYDERNDAFWNPDTTLDVMSYCIPKWISTSTYRGLTERVAKVNEPGGITPSSNEPTSTFRVLIVEPSGPRWSVPYTTPIQAYGDADTAQVFDIDGQLITQVTVFRNELPETDSATYLVPEPEEGWISIQVPGAPPLSYAAPVTVPDAE